MELILSLNDLKKNLDTLETYRNSNEENYKEFYEGLVKRGRCFVVYKYDDAYHFAPSRFIGYKNNNINAQKNDEKDGKVTNQVIEKIVGKKCEQNRTMELEYEKFCSEIHIEPWKVKKKFWII